MYAHVDPNVCTRAYVLYASVCMYVCRIHACMPGTFHSGHLVREYVCFVVMWIF